MPKTKALPGAYLVTFHDGRQIICGNNYKAWYEHASEYALSRYRDVKERHAIVKTVAYCHEPFYDDGGLKYASPEAYQEIINELAESQGRRRLLVDDIVFIRSTHDSQRLVKEIERW